MTVAKEIVGHLEKMPELLQVKVLDFIEYLEAKASAGQEAHSRKDWTTFSLASAMRGLEDEPSSYSPDDLREAFS
ncbi:MAG: DUF2281 domain-containing protein [Planctomycetota bacterium]